MPVSELSMLHRRAMNADADAETFESAGEVEACELHEA